MFGSLLPFVRSAQNVNISFVNNFKRYRNTFAFVIAPSKVLVDINSPFEFLNHEHLVTTYQTVCIPLELLSMIDENACRYVLVVTAGQPLSGLLLTPVQ